MIGSQPCGHTILTPTSRDRRLAAPRQRYCIDDVAYLIEVCNMDPHVSSGCTARMQVSKRQKNPGNGYVVNSQTISIVADTSRNSTGVSCEIYLVRSWEHASLREHEYRHRISISIIQIHYSLILRSSYLPHSSYSNLWYRHNQLSGMFRRLPVQSWKCLRTPTKKTKWSQTRTFVRTWKFIPTRRKSVRKPPLRKRQNLSATPELDSEPCVDTKVERLWYLDLP